MIDFIVKLIRYYKRILYNILQIAKKDKTLPVPVKKYTAKILFPSEEIMENAMKYVK